MKIFSSIYQFGLYHIRPGCEVSVEQKLFKKNIYWSRVLGNFDICVITKIDKLEKLGQRHILRSTGELLGWTEILAFNSVKEEKDLLKWFSKQPSVFLTLIKFRPIKNLTTQLSEESQIAKKIRNILPNSIVFHSLGWHEILLVQGGIKINEYLNNVSFLRRKLSDNIFDTFTIPTFSHNSRQLKLIKDDFHALVSFECQPASENNAISVWKDIGIPKNIYEQRDILMDIEKINTSDLFNKLLKFRKNQSKLLYDTSTTLSTEFCKTQDTAKGLKSNNFIKKATKDYIDSFNKYCKKENILIPDTLCALISMISALSKYYSLGSFGLEHLASFQNILEDFKSINKHQEFHQESIRLKNSCMIQADNIALSVFQRSGHFNCGFKADDYGSGLFLFMPVQSRLVTAASASPLYLLQKSVKKGTFLPFGIVFGASYSPTYIKRTLSYPQSISFLPGSQWWRINHEIGHAYSELFQITENIPDYFIKYINESIKNIGDILDFRLFLDEMFAQWFDYVTCFNKDINFYLKAIWNSWLKVPRIWDNKIEYLSRSLLIYLYNNLDDYTSKMESNDKSINYITIKFKKMINYLNSNVHGFSSFLKDDNIFNNQIDIINTVYSLGICYMVYLQKMEKNIISKYNIKNKSKVLINVSKIALGNILNDIDNPSQLIVECYRYNLSNKNKWSAKSDFALIFTLWNWVNIQEDKLITDL